VISVRLLILLISLVSYQSFAQHARHVKPLYTKGLEYEQRDTFTYVAIPEGETILGYYLQNTLGVKVYHVQGKARRDALFVLPHLLEGHYLLMMEGEAAFYCRRVYIR
jgi:hypothetical protein